VLNDQLKQPMTAIYTCMHMHKNTFSRKIIIHESDHIANQTSMVNINSHHLCMGPDMLEPHICQLFLMMFQMYIAKVSLDVAYVTSKCIF
jgi:hypothetical protein